MHCEGFPFASEAELDPIVVYRLLLQSTSSHNPRRGFVGTRPRKLRGARVNCPVFFLRKSVGRKGRPAQLVGGAIAYSNFFCRVKTQQPGGGGVVTNTSHLTVPRLPELSVMVTV